MGVLFPLKRRDQLLDYVLTLMGRDETDDVVDSSIELLHTQVCVRFDFYFSLATFCETCLRHILPFVSRLGSPMMASCLWFS